MLSVRHMILVICVINLSTTVNGLVFKPPELRSAPSQQTIEYPTRKKSPADIAAKERLRSAFTKLVKNVVEVLPEEQVMAAFAAAKNNTGGPNKSLNEDIVYDYDNAIYDNPSERKLNVENLYDYDNAIYDNPSGRKLNVENLYDYDNAIYDNPNERKLNVEHLYDYDNAIYDNPSERKLNVENLGWTEGISNLKGKKNDYPTWPSSEEYSEGKPLYDYDSANYDNPSEPESNGEDLYDYPAGQSNEEYMDRSPLDGTLWSTWQNTV